MGQRVDVDFCFNLFFGFGGLLLMTVTEITALRGTFRSSFLHFLQGRKLAGEFGILFFKLLVGSGLKQVLGQPLVALEHRLASFVLVEH